jgi:flagellar hook-length control protein FliK
VPQVAQVAAAASLEIRPPVAAQRNDDTDSFSQLLQATDQDAPPPDDTRSRDASTTEARPAEPDRNTDRPSRRDDSDSPRQADSTSASQTDAPDQAPAKHKSDESKEASDASTNAKEKSDDPKNKNDDKSAMDAAAVSMPVANDTAVAVNANAQAAIASAPAIPADPGDALGAVPASAAQGVDAAPPPPRVPEMPQPQAPQAAQAPAPNPAAEINAAAQAAFNGKPALKAKTDSTPQVPQTPADDTQAAAEEPPQAKQASVDTAAPPALKLFQNPQPQGGKPVIQDQNPAPVNVVADAAVKTDTKHEAANTGSRETLENMLAKHFSGDVQVTGNTQIVLPDPARSMQNTVPMSVSLQTSASAATNQPVPLQAAALAIEIASRAKDGSRQFDIRLDPPELGRIDVKLDVDKSGQVNTHLTVDRPETLDLLRRDSQGLERALQQAGLKTSDGGLEFSLRQQTPDGGFQERNQAQTNPQGNTPSIADIDQTATLQAEQYQWAARLRGGVDIRV